MKTGTTLSISTQAAFERALKNKSFQAATYVWLDNLPGVTALPEMPAATYVWLLNLPGVTAPPRVHSRGSIYRNGRVWR